MSETQRIEVLGSLGRQMSDPATCLFASLQTCALLLEDDSTEELRAAIIDAIEGARRLALIEQTISFGTQVK